MTTSFLNTSFLNTSFLTTSFLNTTWRGMETYQRGCHFTTELITTLVALVNGWLPGFAPFIFRT
jgi:hypothetical protein